MPLIKWTPFLEPFEEMDKMFSDITSSFPKSFTPAVDIYETKDAVVVETPLAGVDPNDVEITVENDILTIKGQAEKRNEVEEKNYYRKEVRSGSFYRSIALPSHVKGEDTKAVSEEGMLKITIPKAAKPKGKKIQVSVAKGKKK